MREQIEQLISLGEDEISITIKCKNLDKQIISKIQLKQCIEIQEIHGVNTLYKIIEQQLNELIK